MSGWKDRMDATMVAYWQKRADTYRDERDAARAERDTVRAHNKAEDLRTMGERSIEGKEPAVMSRGMLCDAWEAAVKERDMLRGELKNLRLRYWEMCSGLAAPEWRMRAACAAMQGLLAHQPDDTVGTAALAAAYADALLAALASKPASQQRDT